MNLPQYQCHKRVRAVKIKSILEIFMRDGSRTGMHVIVPEVIGCGAFEVSDDWLAAHLPKVGGYYVVYEDGYTSYSPAEAFEGGYTLIESIPEEITRPFGTCAITGPREDVAFILKHLPDVDDK